jgi:hypothetical protein
MGPSQSLGLWNESMGAPFEIGVGAYAADQ